MTSEIKARTVYPIEFAAAREAAMKSHAAITSAAPWIADDLDRRCQRIVRDNCSVRSKLVKLRQLADEVSAAISPHAICRRGCAHCCRGMAVVISEAEAQTIASAIGRPLSGHGRSLREARLTREETALKYWGSPCPFLDKDECSIHAHRPIACRLHFSLADTPFFCRTDLKPDESAVPNIQLPPFWRAYTTVTQHTNHGDIREFFGEPVDSRTPR